MEQLYIVKQANKKLHQQYLSQQGNGEHRTVNIVVDRIAQYLSSEPEAIISSSQVGVKRPAGKAELPFVSISLNLESSIGHGLGKLARSGHGLVKNTVVVEVDSSSMQFSESLDHFKLWPLPLKHNPDSIKRQFSASDIRISNVTDESNSMEYVLTDKPSERNEYKLVAADASVVFGEPQNPGDLLEVEHWTVAWRDEIIAVRYQGSLTLEIWAEDFTVVDQISRYVQSRLQGNRTVLNERGFMFLQPSQLDAADKVSRNPLVGSPFEVWKQQLSYRFGFETERGGEASSGIPIRSIDVELDEHIQESLTIT